MADDLLLKEQKEGVLKLTLNRPKANAFNDALIAYLHDSLKKAPA